MMFKKGSFEIGGTIYPVAIKVWGSVWLLNLKMIWGLFFVRVVGSCVRAANEKHSNCGNWPLAVVDSWLASDWNEPGLWLKASTLYLRQWPVGERVFSSFFYLWSLAVWPSVWRCILEQQQIQHCQLPAANNDQLGHCLPRVVHATNG